MEIHLLVKPGKKQNEILGHDENGRLCVRLAARAQAGEANEALITFLAKTWKIPKSKIQIVKGQAARYKTIRVVAREL